MTNFFNLNINYLAILVAAIVAMAVGFFWYSDMLFGALWRKESKMDLSTMKKPTSAEMFKTFGTNFIASVVMYYVLALVIYFAGYVTAYEGAMAGILVWLGFVATTQLNGVLFEKQTVTYFLINTCFQLVSLVIAGALIAGWPF